MKAIIFILVITFSSCINSQREELEKTKLNKLEVSNENIKITNIKEEPPKNRVKILKRLKNKINSNEALIVHLFVPLCDNIHQGIIPTTESLGNGLSLRSNLYWATSKGIKRYFKSLPDWKLLESKLDIDTNVLERVIFKKNYKNNAIVYLIADAYRGDRMNNCLSDYFNALSGNRLDSITIEHEKYEIATNADLFIFNGHNGLMDDHPDILPSKTHTPKDAVAIACASHDFFKGYYEFTNSYPLVNTTNLLYPGAFIAEGIINAWAELSSAQACKTSAGQAYYKHKPKSGPNGSQNLFCFGY